MNDQHHQTTPDEKIARHARVWRQADKQFLADRTDETKRLEYRARQQLREAIDTAEKRP